MSSEEKNEFDGEVMQEESIEPLDDDGAEPVIDHADDDDEIVVDAIPVAADDGTAAVDDEDVVIIEALDEAIADELETIDLEAKIAQLEEELAVAQAEAAANLDQMKRVAAEFQNSKRRQEKQLADAIDRASEHVVRSLLPVLDGFDLAFQNAPADLGDEDAAWIDGFQQIQKTLLDLLATQGVEPVPAQGEFDPNMHEAISSEPSDEVESGHIIETLRGGYTHKGQTLRPALVRVAM